MLGGVNYKGTKRILGGDRTVQETRFCRSSSVKQNYRSNHSFTMLLSNTRVWKIKHAFYRSRKHCTPASRRHKWSAGSEEPSILSAASRRTWHSTNIDSNSRWILTWWQESTAAACSDEFAGQHGVRAPLKSQERIRLLFYFILAALHALQRQRVACRACTSGPLQS